LSVDTAKRTARLAPNTAAPTGKIDGTAYKTASLTGAKRSAVIIEKSSKIVFLGIV